MVLKIIISIGAIIQDSWKETWRDHQKKGRPCFWWYIGQILVTYKQHLDRYEWYMIHIVFVRIRGSYNLKNVHIRNFTKFWLRGSSNFPFSPNSNKSELSWEGGVVKKITDFFHLLGHFSLFCFLMYLATILLFWPYLSHFYGIQSKII